MTLDFRWDTGDPSFPEGSGMNNYAKIIEAKPNGISFLMPYRKPESRVRIILQRAADRMTLGELPVADGQTPKDFRLYGVNPGRNTIETVWVQSKENAATKWDMSAHPDFHSIVNLEKTYGLCGLAKADGVQQPFFFDFCTGEWSPLNPSFNTLSLAVTNTGYFVSIQEKAPGKYNLSTSLRQPEQSNYATRTSVVEKLPAFELPAGLSARQFGTYAGVFDPESGTVFLSADKGSGKWVPVLFHIRKGFRVLDEIEAEALIPFSFSVPGGKSQQRLAGYVISSPSAKGGSRFCLLDKESPHLQEPFATLPHRPSRSFHRAHHHKRESLCRRIQRGRQNLELPPRPSRPVALHLRHVGQLTAGTGKPRGFCGFSRSAACSTSEKARRMGEIRPFLFYRKQKNRDSASRHCPYCRL